MTELDRLREFANEHGLEVYEISGGLGVRFADGFDVYWAIPEERWHFLNRNSEPATVEGLVKISARREKVVDAIRRYMAKQKVATDRNSNGHWNIICGAVSSEFFVGAKLTQTLVTETELVTGVKSAFEGCFFRGPSERRAERHLSEFGQALEEVPWPEEEETLIAMPETPLVALGWMGLCKAMKHEASFESPESFIAAAEPKGRIGRALLQVAQRLPNTKASVELCDGSMCIEFSDEYDSFKIAPKSHELRDLLHAMEPEQAGDQLADEYERLNSSRRRALNAVFETLNRHGYFMDSNIVLHGLEPKKYVGREVREFAVELGESLTNAIQQSGEEFAVRQVLSVEGHLADEAISYLGQSEGDVRLTECPLNPSLPAKVILPDLTKEQIAILDERSELLISKYMETDDALTAYSNPLMWDADVDNWATVKQWQELARQHVGGEYPRCDAELILIDHGDTATRDRLISRLKESEPHHEVWDQEVEMVWRLRREMPELAAKWFGPQQHDDVPFAEVRARLGDPIAVCHVLAGIADDEDGEGVPSVLSSIHPEWITCFVEKSQVSEWREAASQWAKETWQWNWGGEHEVLAAAANMGWTEVCDYLCENRFLLHGLLQVTDEDPGIIFADELLLAWSKLKPSLFLMKLVGYVLIMDLDRLPESLARRFTGTAEFIRENPQVVGEISSTFQNKIDVALAISWHRCRKKVT